MALWQSLNVRDFGAKGDGVTDDTAAIQAALQQACVVRIPAGKYCVTQIKIPPECRVIGDGCNQTWLQPIPGDSIDGPLVTDNGNAQKIQLEHLGVRGEGRVKLGLVELGFGSSPLGTQGVIHSCQFRDCDGYGARLNQNISLIERSYFLNCGTALFVLGNELVMNHVQILGARVIDIWAPCIIRNLEIEAPKGPTALNLHRKALISDIHVSLSQSIQYAMEFEQKAGHVHGFLFDTRAAATCHWVKYPGGVVKAPRTSNLAKR